MTEGTSSTEPQDKSTDYRITLQDVRGVGQSTVEKLDKLNIQSVSDLHLLSDNSRIKRRARRKGISIPDSTWSALSAVGNAVDYSGGTHVKSKHLTNPEANHLDDHEFFDISPDTQKPESQQTLGASVREVKTEESLSIDFSEAVSRIASTYTDDPESADWMNFMLHVQDFANESGFFEVSEVNVPPGTDQQLARHHQSPDAVQNWFQSRSERSRDEYMDMEKFKQLIRGFAESSHLGGQDK
jgi:hypothetical protein